VLERGAVGASYAVGGRSERTNLDVARGICSVLDALRPHADGPYEQLIAFVPDRPGHDFRYAVDCARLEHELGWRPRRSFTEGLRETVRWYLDNPAWIERVRDGRYRDWITANYGERGQA
jgi:dTDP-glucose 4,6-dehydratase